MYRFKKKKGGGGEELHVIKIMRKSLIKTELWGFFKNREKRFLKLVCCVYV